MNTLIWIRSSETMKVLNKKNFEEEVLQNVEAMIKKYI